MCLIVDANLSSTLLGEKSDVRKWLLGQQGNPRLVVGGLRTHELRKLDHVRKFLVVLQQAGRLRQCHAESLEGEFKKLGKQKICTSNDLHVLALAIVSGARTIATNDEALIRDFKNPNIMPRPRGKIYRDPSIHRNLLGHTPITCGVKAK